MLNKGRVNWSRCSEENDSFYDFSLVDYGEGQHIHCELYASTTVGPIQSLQVVGVLPL